MFRRYRTVNQEEKRLQNTLTLDVLMDLIEADNIPVEEESLRCKARLHALPATDPCMHLHRSHFIGRFENFARDYQRLAERLGVEIDDIPHKRKTDPVDYRAFYTESQRSRAAHIYANDLRAFDYRFAG